LKEDAKHSIKLTGEEQKYILEEVEKEKGFIWPDNLFKNSTRIELDTFGPQAVTTFTKPIYFRNNSVCLLYIRRLYSRASGNQRLYFCKKVNGVWEKGLLVGGGDW
ncbi:MAG TPA: hypothetical protein VNX68_16630, partial [Nitrosopumilaceae archaeon]|nr:hypothetical protein [Nitrosopumilaceae archaeon]